MVYITAAAAKTVASAATGILIQVNAALTGTITCATGSTTFAVITNPTVGSQFRYGGLAGQGAITITPSATCDITVSMLDKLM